MKKLILSCFIVLLPYLFREEANAQTYQTIVDQIRNDIRDEGTTDTYIHSNADIYRAISIIEEQISGETRIPETSYSTITTAGTAEYDLPTDILGNPTRVAYYLASATSTFKRLDMLTIGGLDTKNENWENKADGLPREYYLRADKVGLHPAPSANYSTTTWKCLKIYYVQNPTDVSASNLTSEPFGGYTQYQNYCEILISGAGGLLTRRQDLNQKYVMFLDNMSRRVREKYDLFIDRTPNRRIH